MCCGWDEGCIDTGSRLPCEALLLEVGGEGRAPSLLRLDDMPASTSAAESSLRLPAMQGKND
jgi:hypothetical protein